MSSRNVVLGKIKCDQGHKSMTCIMRQILYCIQLKGVEWSSVDLHPLNKQNHTGDQQTLILIKKKSDLCVR